MIVIEPLQLHHRALVEPLLLQEKIAFSERNFSTLFLYREVHSWNVVFVGDHKKPIGILGKTYDQKCSFMPLIEHSIISNEAITSWIPALSTEHALSTIFPLSEKIARYLSLHGFSISTLSDDADYLMKREVLISYPGRALDGKRNHLKAFLQQGIVEVKKLSKTTQNDALTVLYEWDIHHRGEKDIEFESQSARQGIEYFSDLSIEGWVTYLNKRPIGVWYGQPLTETIYLVHCAKAIPNIRGAYQFIHQEGARRIPEQYAFLNWEQDLGIPGLRKSKLSYEPYSFEDKWRALIQP